MPLMSYGAYWSGSVVVMRFDFEAPSGLVRLNDFVCY